mmetsp:Transcript_140829/g.450228  ORF Transcript_140829/g.450228 Transcript_140829/m.450228 type:complete len:241 (+) Transcript_140829:2591-3313(+)
MTTTATTMTTMPSRTPSMRPTFGTPAPRPRRASHRPPPRPRMCGSRWRRSSQRWPPWLRPRPEERWRPWPRLQPPPQRHRCRRLGEPHPERRLRRPLLLLTRRRRRRRRRGLRRRPAGAAPSTWHRRSWMHGGTRRAATCGVSRSRPASCSFPSASTWRAAGGWSRPLTTLSPSTSWCWASRSTMLPSCRYASSEMATLRSYTAFRKMATRRRVLSSSSSRARVTHPCRPRCASPRAPCA